MAGLFAVLYGIVAYGVFLLSLLYAIGFVGGLPCRNRSTSERSCRSSRALVVNVLLLSLFAVQHSVMAQQGFQARGGRNSCRTRSSAAPMCCSPASR